MIETLDEAGRVTEHVWAAPPDRTFLEPFLRSMFEEHGEQLIFGPVLPGAAFELRAPERPDKVEVEGGFMTVHWGRRGHFHLCVEGPEGKPVAWSPGTAEFYRTLDRKGLPTTWAFRLHTRGGDQQLTLFFPNPYVTDDDGLTDTPDWSRLALWNHVMETWIGCPADPFDLTSEGFVNF